MIITVQSGFRIGGVTIDRMILTNHKIYFIDDHVVFQYYVVPDKSHCSVKRVDGYTRYRYFIDTIEIEGTPISGIYFDSNEVQRIRIRENHYNREEILRLSYNIDGVDVNFGSNITITDKTLESALMNYLKVWLNPINISSPISTYDQTMSHHKTLARCSLKPDYQLRIQTLNDPQIEGMKLVYSQNKDSSGNSEWILFNDNILYEQTLSIIKSAITLCYRTKAT